MFMTRSRAGVAISLTVFVLIVGITFRTQFRGAKQLLLAAIATTTAIVVLFDVVGGGVGNRFSYEGLDDAGRVETYRSTLQMIKDSPLIGSGLGTYAWSYPEYRSGDVPVRGVWDRAHSTPLELAAELGIPLAAAIIAGWLVIIALLFASALSRRRSSAPIVGAWAIVLIGSLHSLIDFSFQIPGFSIPLCALAGAGLAQTFSSTRSLSRHLHISDTSHRQATATNVP
jgi:O-antigen ligase